ncbi:2-hydroxyacid dehydrogenase [Dactylosporangium sp. CA-139114]|uniref:2-hydroxyacid dehydrogenase n=1 Tax=Dactylosporangium sp. CA-139114 TaxID=3239931 RepID=UPI003D973421
MAAELGQILVTGSSVDDRYLDKLRSAGFTVNLVPELLDEERLGKALEPCTAYLLGGDEFASRAALARAKSLKVVGFLGVGYSSFVDADAARDLGIAVTNTPGTLTNTVAEFTIGMLLAQRRQIPAYAADFRSGHANPDKQRDIGGHRLAVVGLGAIGSRIAEIARVAFGAEVSYYSRTRKPETEERLGLTYRPLPDLLAWSEAVVVMVSESAETRGMIGSEEVRLFDDAGVVLVNTARPSIVEPAALLEGLGNGKIESAAFDNFYGADVPELAALLEYPQSRLLITPHLGSLTHDARDAMAEMCVTSLVNLAAGRPDPNVVNGLGAVH